MTFVLALDQGTTSSRTIVLGHEGQIVAQAQWEFPQHFPKPGWVEHDPEEIWQSQRRTLLEAIGALEGGAGRIAALGISNQRETALVWDRQTGMPIGPAIVWQDRRTAPRCEDLNQAGLAKSIQQKTGLLPDSYFSATKFEWMLDHIEGARQRAEAGKLACGTVDSWLIWRLTGGRTHVTDVTNASRTMLFNIETLDWDHELLQIFRIPREILPRVVNSSGMVGEVIDPPEAAGIPIGGIAGDQQAALFGQACFQPGMIKNTLGTGCFALMNTGPKPVFTDTGLLTTVAWKIGNRTEYALEGSLFVAGAIVQWLRDGLGIIESASELEALAKSVPDSGGVTLVPALAGLGAPYWDPYARGLIGGLTRGTTRGHIARAALEGLAFQVVELIQLMRTSSGVEPTELRMDGGATANDLLMQYQADLLRIPVVRPKILESTAVGAAYLAGLASGVWSDTDDLAALWKLDQTFVPNLPAEEVDRLTRDWRQAVERSRGWARP